MIKEDNLTNHQFIIKFDEPTSYGYTAIVSNYFVEEILKKKIGTKDLKSKQIFFRLFRTGILGDILYKKGEEYIKSEDNFAETEFLAVIFESYMFLVRSIYDYMLHFLNKKFDIKENSFHKFISKIEKDDYPKITGKFRDHLKRNKLFKEIRDLRDSIKQKTPYIFIYIKDHKYRVEGTIYKRNGTKETFDELLYLKIFGYSTALLLLMSYITENMTSISFKDQIKHLKQKATKR